MLVERGVTGGLLDPASRPAVEAALVSQSVLAEGQAALAGAAEPGAAKAAVESARGTGLLVAQDEALLERLAAEREPVALARHRARLTWKEQDDLAYGWGSCLGPRGRLHSP